ncbi:MULTISPECIES: hypothetical protein [unclassified Solwaraspora]|uniref:hypothetical protein n=1 Tax=unclassified Solwaraspora TaxID=2627926 RepID=UPI00248CD5D5|nr:MULTISPECIES: hypothetical protein [unclassified Solwaraspora]WBB96740.1 hypothetical protein O7553_26205 [Solwaraspora sp. WMMA2059]WBC19356.1 hypothetical protein O7543_21165 [Solwaraspora sp. WMMA2080]WJK33201.1 hypothetical protein O7610_21170 [Solwaraspora sp. WMMA2065]
MTSPGSSAADQLAHPGEQPGNGSDKHPPEQLTGRSGSPTEPGPAPTEGGATVKRVDRWGWFGVAAITAVVAATWIPQLALPFGDNHVGRIFARHGLHLRNLQEKGLVGSSFSADWSPYSDQAYAHHPPLLNMLDATFGLLPGSGAYEILIGPFLLGLLVVPAAAALLRAFAIAWIPTLVAVGTMAATGFFWLYSPLMFDMGLILAMSATIVALRKRADPPRWLVVCACVTALLATLASWPGIGLAAVLGLWLFAARRLDRVTVAVGASMVLGVLVSLAFIVGVSGMEDLTSQTEFRTAGGGFTARQFLVRQRDYATELLPTWYLVIFPIAAVAGLFVRRTRFYLLVTLAFVGAWVIGLNNGSFIHDYWAYPVLIPGVVAMGALFDLIVRRVPTLVSASAGIAAGVGLSVAFGAIALGPTARDYVYEPADAGRLVDAYAPGPQQQRAWVMNISTPRWVAYYWDLPPAVMSPDVLSQAQPDDLILFRTDLRQGWVPESVPVVDTEGRYGLLRVADIRSALPAVD